MIISIQTFSMQHFPLQQILKRGGLQLCYHCLSANRILIIGCFSTFHIKDSTAGMHQQVTIWKRYEIHLKINCNFEGKRCDKAKMFVYSCLSYIIQSANLITNNHIIKRVKLKLHFIRNVPKSLDFTMCHNFNEAKQSW